VRIRDIAEMRDVDGVVTVSLYRRKERPALLYKVLAHSAHDVSDDASEAQKRIYYVVYEDQSSGLIFIRNQAEFMEQCEPVVLDPNKVRGVLD